MSDRVADGKRRIAEWDERDRLEKAHSFGRHRLFQARCPLCIAKRDDNYHQVAAALANVFNPLPVSVPRGFRRDGFVRRESAEDREERAGRAIGRLF